MRMNERRKCLNCRRMFRPDPRNRRHRRYCSASACRKAGKAARQARWLSKPSNRDCFRGPEHVARVRAWRAAHPDRPRKGRVLQDVSLTQVVDKTGQTGHLPPPVLQDDWHTQGLF